MNILAILIYIPVWIDQKPNAGGTVGMIQMGFTFQYGQIRNQAEKAEREAHETIYIPVWIDQKH